MSDTTAPIVLMIEERVDRDLGCDEPFFLAHTSRRHRVRLAQAEELTAAQTACFPFWGIYAAVALLRHRRARLFFTCSHELREDLSEAEAADIFSDLLELQQLTAAATEAH